MKADFPVGWFYRDVLLWGEFPGKTACFARGGMLEVPDVRHADTRTILDLASQNALFLATIGSTTPFQVHWTVECDFGPTLLRHRDLRRPGTPWCQRTGEVRIKYYEARQAEGSLRRERVYLYLARKSHDLVDGVVGGARDREAYSQQVAAELEARFQSLRDVFRMGGITAFGDEAHCVHLRKFLNPSLASGVLADPVGAVIGFDSSRSVRRNCLRSEISPLAGSVAPGKGRPLMLDGFYHAQFVMRELPRGTRPGMLASILGSAGEGICVTLNVYPLAVDEEIERLRREINDLSLFLSDRKSIGVENDIVLRRARIDSLLSSVTIPFRMLLVIRVWDATLEGLSAKTLGIKTALHRLDGAEFFQVTGPSQSLNLFYETMPGNLGSRYRGWDVYVENRNLVDLLPFSSGFCGHLDGAQALYESPDGSLVGVRLLSRDGTPQHSMVAGVNGSGKSAFLIDLMSQSDADWSYRFVQEEGLAFATFARLAGMESLVLRESGERTLNPFDTFGLPLTSTNIAGVVRTCMKLVGQSRDQDRNRRREGLIGEYVFSHFDDCAEDWKNADEDRWQRLAKSALVAEGLRSPGDEFIDGFTRLRELRESDLARVDELVAATSEQDVLAYSASQNGRHVLRSMVFSELASHEYPQFSGLVSLMRNARQGRHRSGPAADELDLISTELGKGRRVGGLVGSFIDGPTTINLQGPGLHLDTSLLADGLLKELAGFVVFDRVRQFILTLPRAQAKVMVLDELRRILVIPGAPEFVKEALAQMRKYRCVFVGAFQEASQIDEIDPALTDLLLGQCKQHFLLRQNNRDQIARIGRVIGLPKAAQRAVASHPLVEHQPEGRKASYLTYFSREADVPLCGTVRVEIDPYMLYVANSSGRTFDERTKALARYPSAYAAVVGEVNRQSPNSA